MRRGTWTSNAQGRGRSHTAGIMLTNPSTLGVERRIAQVAHRAEAGGLVYYDGANLNAILGKVRPGTWGSTSST